jgi:hypothetical protein
LKKIVAILILVSLWQVSMAQFIIAGQPTSNDYFQDMVPDSNYCAYGSSSGAIVTKSVDINSDGTMDFKLVAYRGPGLGNPGASIYVSALGSSQIASGGSSTCTYSTTATPCCGTLTSVVAKAFVYGDTINSPLNWSGGTLYLANSYYCSVGQFDNVNQKYIGTRIFVGSEILYGYIMVRLSPGNCLGFTLYEYACEKECNSLPQITTATSSTLICSGETSTLTASGALTYTWSTGANSPAIIVSPSVTTTYTVDVTYSNGCTNSAVFTQSVNACIGIHEYNNDWEIKAHPNPANEKIEFVLSTSPTDLRLKIVNSLGQIILEDKKTNLNKFNLDVSDYPNGIYFVEVESSQGTLRAKFVKE